MLSNLVLLFVTLQFSIIVFINLQFPCRFQYLILSLWLCIYNFNIFIHYYLIFLLLLYNFPLSSYLLIVNLYALLMFNILMHFYILIHCCLIFYSCYFIFHHRFIYYFLIFYVVVVVTFVIIKLCSLFNHNVSSMFQVSRNQSLARRSIAKVCPTAVVSVNCVKFQDLQGSLFVLPVRAI